MTGVSYETFRDPFFNVNHAITMEYVKNVSHTVKTSMIRHIPSNWLSEQTSEMPRILASFVEDVKMAILPVPATTVSNVFQKQGRYILASIRSSQFRRMTSPQFTIQLAVMVVRRNQLSDNITNVWIVQISTYAPDVTWPTQYLKRKYMIRRTNFICAVNEHQQVLGMILVDELT